jgi:PBP1b-binding outer membrane lipoprotein LpoB
MKAIVIMIALHAFLLAGCDNGKPEPPPPKLFESQRNTMDKAKAVEGTLQQQADQQLQEVDKQSQ